MKKMARLVVMAMVAFVLFSAASVAAGEKGLSLIPLLEKERAAVGSGLSGDSVIDITVSITGNSLTEENGQPVWSTTFSEFWSWRVEQLIFYYNACDGNCPYYYIWGSLLGDNAEYKGSGYLYYYVNSGQTDYLVTLPVDNSVRNIQAEMLLFQGELLGFFKGHTAQYDENGYIIAISDVSGGEITIKWYYNP